VHGRPGEQFRETDDVAEIEQLHVRQDDVLDCLHVVHLGGRTVTRRVAPHQPVTGGPWPDPLRSVHPLREPVAQDVWAKEAHHDGSTQAHA
jgi:hypothetical protein